MKYTSKTGLLSSEPKNTKIKKKNVQFNFEVSAINPPFTTKPFTGLYNPFAKGCSVLCNHPAGPEVKRMLQKAKDNWGEDGKSLILPQEVAAIRAELEEFQLGCKLPIPQHTCNLANNISDGSIELSDITQIVPEEMFRRYTETDSRPMTPTPTIASAHTRASATRKCVTPDPIITTQIKEKTLLILDLRRSHSQETLSCYGGTTSLNETPLIRIMNVHLSPASSRHCLTPDKKLATVYKVSPKNLKSEDKNRVKNEDKNRLQVPNIIDKYEGKEKDKNKDPEKELDFNHEQTSDNEEEYVKRRGRRRKKRRASSSVSVFRVSTEPETLVSGFVSKNPSARPSVTEKHIEDIEKFAKSNKNLSREFNIDSFLDNESLKQLRRELTKEVVELEIDERRKIALEEALKTVPFIRDDCAELIQLQKATVLPQIDSSFRFSLPTKFNRASVRFELPMDSRTFDGMTPMKYLEENVYLTSARKLLYVFVFNFHRIRPAIVLEETENDQPKEDQKKSKENALETKEKSEEIQTETKINNEEDDSRLIMGKEIIVALGTLMGKQLNTQQREYFQRLVGWSNDETYNFRSFSSICALCERLLAKDFYPNLPWRKEDPCQAIEVIDFEALERKMKNRNMDYRLMEILLLLKTA